MWLHNNKEVNDIDYFPRNVCGFVYKITNLTNNKIYIGKKILYNSLKKKLTIKELKQIDAPGRKPTFKRVAKESNWKQYWGSNKELIKEVQEKGELEFKKEILILCTTKKQLTYWEMHYQCVEGVITNPELSYNDSILGKFFPKDL